MIGKDDIDTLRECAESEPLISELSAFGSRVSGNEDKDSDLDVAVTLDLPNHKLHANWFENQDMWARQLSEQTGCRAF